MNNNEEADNNSDQNEFNLGKIFNKPSTDILHALSGKITEILQNEINLLKDGLKADLKAGKITLGLFGAGILLGLITLVLLFVSLTLALSRFFPGWLAGLIVSSFTGAITIVITLTGWNIRAKDPFTNLKNALNTKNVFSTENKEIRRAA